MNVGCLLIYDGTSLYSFEHQNIILWVYLHMPMILSINCCDLQAYFENGNVRKDSFDGGLYILCF